MKYLADNGLEDNTVVIDMGDNGFSFGEQGLIDKRHMYEESMKVPLLVWAPGINFQQHGLKQMVQNIDIGPTICLSRSEEHTSELQSLMRISYAVFCLKEKKRRHV